jgi:hypothetical protein
MKKNVLLIVVDCLRYDFAMSNDWMPSLAAFASANTAYVNHWATSHCTDPCMTHMLSGHHPDDLRLYSMMYEIPEYTIPDDVRMISQDARDLGFKTAFLTNNGRWYSRGVDEYVDTRNQDDRWIISNLGRLILSLPEPWFVICHTAGMHVDYQGGSYDEAAKMEDKYLYSLFQTYDPLDTMLFITADHGEGLGDHDVMQHGHGLWPCLTHIPLITNQFEKMQIKGLTDHGTLYEMLSLAVSGKSAIGKVEEKALVFQAGETYPNIVHRGIVYPKGHQYIFAREGEAWAETFIPDTKSIWTKRKPRQALQEYCKNRGIDLYTDQASEVLIKLGYMERQTK